MATNASMEFTKYEAKILSPGRCSCGIILSIIEIILVNLFLRTIRATVPKAGAIKGSQNLIINISGLAFFK